MTMAPAAMEDGAEKPGKSRLISKVLAPAIRLWLRSQVEQVEDLQVEIGAGDRQILSGSVPQVRLSAEKAIYQGLHLSQLALTGKQIQINLGQVLRGQPLRLLQPVAIAGELHLRQTDLQASLQSPLLRTGILEFLRPLLLAAGYPAAAVPGLALADLGIDLGDQTIALRTVLISAEGQPFPLALTARLTMIDPHQLGLVEPQWLQAPPEVSLRQLDHFLFDLGPDTWIHHLSLNPDLLACQGQLTVMPDV